MAIRTISKSKPRSDGHQFVTQEWLFQVSPWCEPTTYRAFIHYDGSHRSQSRCNLWAINVKNATEVLVASRHPQDDYGLDDRVAMMKPLPDDVFEAIFVGFAHIVHELQPS